MNKSIMSHNDKGEPHGLWESYYSGGNLSYKCFFQNSKEVGYEELYDFNNGGKLVEKTYYL